MNNFLAALGVHDFHDLLGAYHAAGVEMEYLIDGGAGSGSTSSVMLRRMPSAKKVWAFEPFEGNHRFFDRLDPRIELAKYALYKERASMTFEVSTIVPEDSTWGARGLAGYSSAGRINANPRSGTHVYDVDCVRADEFVGAGQRIDFVKLDLQGGEYDAIIGMEAFLPETQLMWVEFGGQPGLLDLLDERDFVLFDTEYLFHGKPTEEALAHFIVTEAEIPLSTGTFAWKGIPKRTWSDYMASFEGFKKSSALVQTDIVCVNRKYLTNFCSALPKLSSKK